MSARKSLSGATMGMRFMQRQTPTKPTQSSPTATTSQHSTPIKPENDHQNQNESSDDVDLCVPVMASKADMYGISAEIIGRRSFNHFRKPVEETWIAAMKSRQQFKIDSKVEKQQITDEELLERYKNYVKGGGDEAMLGKEAAVQTVGNLKKKRKRQQMKKEQQRIS